MATVGPRPRRVPMQQALLVTEQALSTSVFDTPSALPAPRVVAPPAAPAPPPPPPPPNAQSRWAVFNQTERELTWIVVDKVTSIRILAPTVGTYPVGYATAIWRVVVKMSHDEVVRDFHASVYAPHVDELSAYNNARDDAFRFARGLAAQVDRDLH